MRITKALTRIVAWYASPSGILFGLSLILLGLALLPTDFRWVFGIAGLVGLAVFVPYRLRRQEERADTRLANRIEHADRRAVDGDARRDEQLADLRASMEDQVANVDARQRGELASARASMAEDMANRIAAAERVSANWRELIWHDLADIQKRLDDLGAAQLDETQMLHQLGSRLDNIAAGADSLDARTDAITTKVRTLVHDLDRTMSLQLARRDASSPSPRDGIVLIAAIPRSGSTWLLDMLRTLPSIHMEPMAAAWLELGLSGRRYPRGLSDGPTAEVTIETARGVGARIPARVGASAGTPQRPTVAVEKFHPEFYAFTAPAFDRRLVDLEKGRPGNHLVVVYLVRSPLDVMWSFARYKDRDKTWYRHLHYSDIPEFIARSFQSLRDLADIRPGVIVDFDLDLRNRDRLGRVFERVARTESGTETERMVDAALAATSRPDLIASQHQPFLGNSLNHRTTDFQGPDGAWVDKRDWIDSAIDDYQALISASSQ
jgi:hypothetical protein